MGSDEAQDTIRFNEGLLLDYEVLHFLTSSRRTVE